MKAVTFSLVLITAACANVDAQSSRVSENSGGVSPDAEELPSVVDHDFDYIGEFYRGLEARDASLSGYDSGPRPRAEARTDKTSPFNRSQFPQTASAPITVSGKVRLSRNVPLRNALGTVAQHKVLEIEFRDGRSVVVSLGPSRTSRQLNISPGDSVTVTGTRGVIQNRRVLFARKVTTDGSTYRIDAPVPDVENAHAKVQGSVEDFNRIFLYPDGQAQSLLRVRFEDGTTALIDLGRETSWLDLGLQEDAFLVVNGWPDTVEGQRILRARQISVNGDTTVLR